MKFKAFWGVINAVVLVIVSWRTFSYLVGACSVEVDEVSVAPCIVDVDDFDLLWGRGRAFISNHS